MLTEVAEIGVVMLSAMGDAVHTLPVVGALKRAFPKARLTWIIQKAPHRLVANHPAVDDFVLFDRRRGLATWRSYVEARRELKRHPFDLLLVLQVYLKAGILTALADARVKLGFDRARARDLNWLVTTERIPARPAAHVQDQYFEFLHYLGVGAEPVTWDLRPTSEEQARQREFFARLERPACAVVVGTSKPQKNWRPERYARVLEALESDFGLQPVLVGGHSESERERAHAIMGMTNAKPVDALGDDVRRLLYLLAGSRLVLSPDTGPLHIARALDIPVVGLYGYTNPKRYGPYRKFGELVVDGYARFPGEDYPCTAEHRGDGMTRVTVARVLEKIQLAHELYLSDGPSR